jgi:HK97 family phage major capsid protein
MANESRKRALTFSSEYPYERWFGIEILDHKPSSIRMDFITSGRAPLLIGHDQRLVVGVIEKASVDTKQKVGRADTRFGRSALAEEKLQDVDDGILVNTSAGYRVHELVLEKMSDEGDTYRVTDWEPLEVSLVGIPADPTVGVGRSVVTETPEPDATALTEAVKQGFATVTDVIAQTASGAEVPEVRISITAAAAAIPKESTVDKDDKAAAGASADTKLTASQVEKERRLAIANLCKANKIDSRLEHQWIQDGVRFEDTRDASGALLEKGIGTLILDVMEERGKARPAIASELGLTRKETESFSLFRVIRYLKDKADPAIRNAAAFELDCSKNLAQKLGRAGTSNVLIPAEVLTRSMSPEVMQRAMSVVPGAAGGYLVNTTNMGFIDILRNRSVARAMGARVLSGLEGNVTFGRQTGKPAVTWQGGEGVSTTAADQTLGQLSMTPKTAIVITDVSEQLLRQSNPSAEQFVMADLAADIAIDGVDASSINGTGGAQPLGIKNTTGITTGQDASTITYAKLGAFVTVPGALNAIRGNPGFVTNITGASVLAQRQRFSGTTRRSGWATGSTARCSASAPCRASSSPPET